MLKRRHRSLSAQDVSELFEMPHETVSNRFFRLIWIPLRHDERRFVVILPKSLGLQACQRNRIRRHIFAELHPLLSHWTGGVRLAILVRTAALTASRRLFRTEFSRVLQKAGFPH